MNIKFLSSIFLLFSMSISNAQTSNPSGDLQYGTYRSGMKKPLITIELGARGRAEFFSSKCPGKMIAPAFKGEYFEGTGYIIFYDDLGITIEGNGNACLPEGRYLKE